MHRLWFWAPFLLLIILASLATTVHANDDGNEEVEAGESKMGLQHEILSHEEQVYQKELNFQDPAFVTRFWKWFDSIQFEQWVLLGTGTLGVVGASLFMAFTVLIN